MKQSKARKHLENYRFLLQKYRSNAKEELDPDVYKIAEVDLVKWILDDTYCPLQKICDVLDKDYIEPLFFFNMMTILHKFSYSLVAIAPLYGIEDFPEPNMNWLRGWEKEND